MAQPACFSPDAPAYSIDEEHKLIIANPGNWRQGQGGDPLNEPVYFYSWTRNGLTIVPGPDVPLGRATRATPADFEANYRTLPACERRTMSYANLAPGRHHFAFQVVAATHSGAYGEASEWWELGAGFLLEPLRPYIVDVWITVPEEPPPPPPVDRLPDSLQAQIDMTDAERNMALAKDFLAVIGANEADWVKIQNYIAAIYAIGNKPGVEVLPPSCRTHAMRWLVGRIQESVIARKYGRYNT